MTIDASSLPGGINISAGGGVSRFFRIGAGQTVSLSHLVLSSGSGVGPDGPVGGGAIYNEGILSLTRCQLIGNAVPEGAAGGAILNTGTLTALQSSMSGTGGGIPGVTAVVDPVSETITVTDSVTGPK